jgi:hypothetical protein
MYHRFLAPTFTPKDRAFSVESWVRGAMVEELRMGVVHRDHYAEVLLDTLDKELKESSAFVLITHLFLELREKRLELFGSVET